MAMDWKVVLAVVLIASATLSYKFVQTNDRDGLANVKDDHAPDVGERTVPDEFSQAREETLQQFQSKQATRKDDDAEQMHIGRNLDANDINAHSAKTFAARQIGEFASVDDEDSTELSFVAKIFGSPLDTSVATWAVQLDTEINIGARTSVEEYFESHASQHDSLREIQFGEYLPIPDEID